MDQDRLDDAEQAARRQKYGNVLSTQYRRHGVCFASDIVPVQEQYAKAQHGIKIARISECCNTVLKCAFVLSK